jgi:hypothetical protein
LIYPDNNAEAQRLWHQALLIAQRLQMPIASDLLQLLKSPPPAR